MKCFLFCFSTYWGPYLSKELYSQWIFEVWMEVYGILWLVSEIWPALQIWIPCDGVREILPIWKSKKMNKYQLIKWTNPSEIKVGLWLKPDEWTLDTHVYSKSQLELEVECLTTQLGQYGQNRPSIQNNQCQILLVLKKIMPPNSVKIISLVNLTVFEFYQLLPQIWILV